VIVIDKPAGLVVHPAAGNPDRTLVNALIHHCGPTLSGIGGVRRPGIVHRLDKDTSGVMVVAKTDHAHAALVAQFQARSIERAYGALVWGVPSPARGRIVGNIGRGPRNRKKMAVLARGGRPAATNYRVVRAFGDTAAQLECRLDTGRTHQIRVHLAHIGHPVIGDPVYGGRRGRKDPLGPLPHQALHAYLLGFRHPESGETMRFTAPFPPYFNEVIGKLERV
jgi:23S rRNA pseudouridine1911/1915/1917 synthase